MNLPQKPIMEHIGRAERARFMSKRVIFQPFKVYKKFFTLYFGQKINLSLVSVVSVVRRLPFCSEVKDNFWPLGAL